MSGLKMSSRISLNENESIKLDGINLCVCDYVFVSPTHCYWMKSNNKKNKITRKLYKHWWNETEKRKKKENYWIENDEFLKLVSCFNSLNVIGYHCSGDFNMVIIIPNKNLICNSILLLTDLDWKLFYI